MNFSKFSSLFVLLTLLLSSNSRAECFKNADALFEQGREYFSHEQFLLASQQFSFFTLLNCDQDSADKGRVRWAQALFELGENAEADSVIGKISRDSKHASTSRVIRAWYQPTVRVILEPEEMVRFKEYDRKVEAFPNVKSPWLAGGLSAIVPGMGQAYNGNFQSGIFSFILNALFLSATLELQRHQMSATAIASGTIFSVLYVGNIIGSVQSSKTLNEQYQQPMTLELKNSLFPELSF